MEKFGPWTAIATVFYITPCVFAILAFIPETLHLSTAAATKSQRDNNTPKTARETLAELKSSLALLGNKDILLVMVSFFIQPALFAAYSSTVGQYVSKHFGWTLAQTSYLLGPPLNLINLVVIVAVPGLSGVLTRRYRFSVFGKDLFLARVSMALLIVAALMEGFSRGIVLFVAGLVVGTFGSSHGPLLRAVATAHVDGNMTSRLYSLMSVVEMSGTALGGPVLAACFNVGLARGGLWKGLPWFYIAGLISLALVSLAFVRKPRDNKVSSEDEENGGLGYQSAEEQP